MATYELAPGEVLKQCPYNKSHQITNVRMLTHLDKCRRNYVKELKALNKTPEIVVCRYNYAHQVNKIELDYHHRNCPDQHRIVEHIKYHDSDAFNKSKNAYENKKPDVRVKLESNPAPQSNKNYDEEEDWDKDSGNTYEPGYDPSKKLDQGSILYMPRGLSKSERKAFRREQSKKCREAETVELEDGEIPESHMCLAGAIKKE